MAAAQDLPVPTTTTSQSDQLPLFTQREASGTSWVPDSTPMFGSMTTWGKWGVMLHGVVFAQFQYEPGEIHRTGGSSTHQVSSVNWGMLTARRRVGAGRVGLHAMLSLEPFTVSHCGFLDLLATGEMCEGDTIHDRQHPHDLTMELAADFDRPLRGSLRWQVYAGLVGEPPIGPPAFPHRQSAFGNPMAPIGHHWLDATHISFGLVTGALYQRRWKAEVSAFNGREPDERRTNLELASLNSVAGRFTVLPSSNLSIQISAAQLNDAEQEFSPTPRADVFRATASAIYTRAFSRDRLVAITVAAGVNAGREFIPQGSFFATTPAVLAEGSVMLGERHVVFGRGEFVKKPAEDLHAHEFATEIFGVGKLQAGYVRNVAAWHGVVAGIGGTFSVALPGPTLAPRYGGRAAPGFGVFLMIRAPRHEMHVHLEEASAGRTPSKK